MNVLKHIYSQNVNYEKLFIDMIKDKFDYTLFDDKTPHIIEDISDLLCKEHHNKWCFKCINFDMMQYLIDMELITINLETRKNIFESCCLNRNYQIAKFIFSFEMDINDFVNEIKYSKDIKLFELFHDLGFDFQNSKCDVLYHNDINCLEHIMTHHYSEITYGYVASQYCCNCPYDDDLFERDHQSYCGDNYDDDTCNKYILISTNILKFLYSISDKTIKYTYDEYYEVKQIVIDEKENYFIEFVEKLKFNQIYSNPMFDINIFVIELPKYLFY